MTSAKKESVEKVVSENLKEIGLNKDLQQSEGGLTEFEQEQKTKGWNPDGPKSAEEWARAKPLYDEIEKRGDRLKRMERTIEEMKSLMSKQEHAAYQRAMTELMKNRDAAIALGDVTAVKNLERQMASTQPAISQQQIPSATQEFMQRNKDWYEGTSYEAMKMTQFAKQRDNELASKNLSPDEHMAILEEHIQKEFPKYFNKEDDRQSSSQAVESGTGDSNVVRTVGKKKYTLKDLNSYQKQAARDFERLGVIKVDEYIEQLIKVGEL